jgi:hypothetical protein
MKLAPISKKAFPGSGLQHQRGDQVQAADKGFATIDLLLCSKAVERIFASDGPALRSARAASATAAQLAMAALQGLLWHQPCGATDVLGILRVRRSGPAWEITRSDGEAP